MIAGDLKGDVVEAADDDDASSVITDRIGGDDEV